MVATLRFWKAAWGQGYNINNFDILNDFLFKFLQLSGLLVTLFATDLISHILITIL